MAPHLSAGGRKRKVKKPEAERRRRARIAVAVERLRTMMLEEGAAPPPPPPCTPPHLHHLSLAPRQRPWQRLEKVVVLELTVSHLRRLAAHQPGDGRQQFREGYRRCQEEVLKFLGSIAAVQPHAAARLRQQLFLTSVGADRQNAASPANLHDVPAAGELRRAPDNGTDPSRLTLGKEQPQPRPVTSKNTVPRRPCGPDLAPPHHAPYSHMHWKKCLKPRAGTCSFWRPW